MRLSQILGRFRIVCLVAALCGAWPALGQNLLGNSTFSSDFSAWKVLPSPNGTSGWSPEDADESPGSGSAFFTTTHPNNSEFVPLLSQCVPVAAGQAYALSQEVRFLATETTPGAAQIVLTWSASPDCKASISGIGLVTERTPSTTWFVDSGAFTAPAGAVAASVQLGMDKDQAGGTLSAWVDNVSFAPAGSPTDTLRGWLPVVGSLRGNFDSNFKTSVRILNPNASPLSGRLVFHPAGQSEDASDPSMGYSLGPGQSFAWDDVVAAMGLSGLGSMDVTGDLVLPPVVVTRIFDDAGEAGTSGFTEPLFEAATQSTLPIPNLVGYLLPPSDGRYRYNVGVRVVGAPIQLTVAVLDPGGTVLHTLTRTYTENSFEQISAAEFAGVSLENGQSLKVTAEPRLLIVYGATVDNVTNDPSAQFLTTFRALQP